MHYRGEIDVLEGVNNNVNNQYTLHTREGCSFPFGECGANGGFVGCKQMDNNDDSFGEKFNKNKGIFIYYQKFILTKNLRWCVCTAVGGKWNLHLVFPKKFYPRKYCKQSTRPYFLGRCQVLSFYNVYLFYYNNNLIL